MCATSQNWPLIGEPEHLSHLADEAIVIICSCGSCGTMCADGQSCCSGVCVDLQTNQNNCGRCNFLCNTIPGTQTGVCSGGWAPIYNLNESE